MGHHQFKASNGWLDSFKKRHNIRQFTVSGEAADVSGGFFFLDEVRELSRQKTEN